VIRGKRIYLLWIIGLLLLGLTACGKKEKTDNQRGGQLTSVLSGEYVYVPNFAALKDTEGKTFLSHSLVKGDTLYYSLMSYYDLVTMKYDTQFIKMDRNTPGQGERLQLEEPQADGYEANVSCFQVDQEGNLYVAYYLTPPYVEGKPYDNDDFTTYIVKYDNKQQKVYEKDLKKVLVDENNGYISAMVIGVDGRILASSYDAIYVLKKNGDLQATIRTQAGQINDMFTTVDGKVFCLLYNSTGKKMELAEVDTKKKSLGEVYQNLPEGILRVSGGAQGKLLVMDNSYLYEYDLATGQAVPVVSWMDCYLNSNGINHFTMLEDGNILLTYADHSNDTKEVVKLTKTKASELPQKEQLVLASLYDTNQNQELQNAIMEFNRTSTQYKIVYKSYIDPNMGRTENTIPDAKSLMHADLLSDNPPDLIDLSYGRIGDLERAGILEDLTPYLEKSQVIKKEDFVPSVLQAYTYGGKQVTIPGSFRLNTLIGKKALVGDTPGWTLEDMMQLAEQYPDARLMEMMTPEMNLEMCLQYNSSYFVDYEAGTCRFDSPEFIRVLEFARAFENYPNPSYSLPTQLRQNKVLLKTLSIYSVQEYQMYQLMLEEPAVCIGYPMVDGSNGVFIEAAEMYGITAKSEHKDGAWAFIEKNLSNQGVGDGYTWGFPTRVDELEEVFEEAQRPEYKKDENGQLQEVPKTTATFADWEAEIYPAEEEQIEVLRKLIAEAKPLNDNDAEILKIIKEEAQAYFVGQKTAEDVAKIIQSRVSIFVSENG